MPNIHTVSGKIVRFEPETVKIYPDVNLVKYLVKRTNFGVLVKPQNSLAIYITFHEDTAVRIAKYLAEHTGYHIAIGSNVEMQYTQGNGNYLTRLTKLNGSFLPTQPVSNTHKNESKDVVKSSSAQVAPLRTASSSDNSSVESSSTAPASSSSDSNDTSGIEAGLASLRAMFNSSSDSSASSSSSEMASSVSSESSESSSSEDTSPIETEKPVSTSSVDSSRDVSADDSGSVASSSFEDSSSSDTAVNENPFENTIEKPKETPSIASEEPQSSEEASSKPSSEETQIVNSASQEPVQHSHDDIEKTNHDRLRQSNFAHDDSDESMDMINHKLGRFDKYRSSIERGGSYHNAKGVYNHLVEESPYEVRRGLQRAYDAEHWRDFGNKLKQHAGVDFNLTLNQRITDACMNYAVQCNSIPGNIDVKKKKPKKKPVHLTDKNVF